MGVARSYPWAPVLKLFFGVEVSIIFPFSLSKERLSMKSWTNHKKTVKVPL